jgi:hypothetical protein
MSEKKLILNYLKEDYKNSYEIYYQRFQYYTSLHENLTKLKLILSKFLEEKLNTFKIKDEFNKKSTLDDNYIKLVSIIKKEISFKIKGGISTFEEILKNLNEIRDTIKLNNKNYTTYFNYQNSFNSKLDELEICQNKFYESVEKAEYATLEFMEKKIKNQKIKESEYEQKNKLQNICKEEKEKYISKISEINKLIQNFNEKQKFIFNINKDIKVLCYKNYINTLFSFFQLTNDTREIIEEKKQTKSRIIQITNEKEDLEKSEYKIKDKICFIQYESKIDLIYENSNNDKYLMMFQEMGKLLGDSYKDKMKEYKTKKELNHKLKEILDLDDKISEKDEEYLESILKTDIGKSSFIICLTQLRTCGKLEKSNLFIEYMSKIINKLLEYEKENKEFIYLKSCLILSQTFYYLDKDNQKIYISNYLKNNRWITSPNFWRGFIDYILKKELNKDDLQISNYFKVLIAQLITYINNMIEFNIDKRIIIKIVDEFLKQYNYPNKNSYGSLFFMIDEDPTMIEKLRTEIHDNPDLENQLYKENINDNDKEEK